MGKPTFTVQSLALAGLKQITRYPAGDSRGGFSRLFCAEELLSAGWKTPVQQINHSTTAQRGTVRGLHFQNPPHAEMKLVTCLRGEVWDVAVDVRAASPTFLHWHGTVLSARNHHALLIPEGFAHGFQTLSDDVELLYCHSEPYTPGGEGALNALDVRLGIAWPLPIAVMSSRDTGHALIAESRFTGIPF